MCGSIILSIIPLIVGGVILCYIGGKIGDYLSPEDKNMLV